jgi:hypothetical protein
MKTTLLVTSAVLLAVGFLPSPAGAADPMCVSLTSCSADVLAVCASGPCTADGGLGLCGTAVAVEGDATGNCVAVVGRAGTADGGIVAASGTVGHAEGGWVAASGTGTAAGGLVGVGVAGAEGSVLAATVAGPTQSDTLAVSQCGVPASATLAVTVFCTAEGEILAFAPLGSASCEAAGAACIAIGRASASCTSDRFCAAVGGMDDGGAQCYGGAVVDLVLACYSNGGPSALP